MGPKELFQWTISREELYLQIPLDTLRRGQHVENGWKPQVYIDPLHCRHFVQPLGNDP